MGIKVTVGLLVILLSVGCKSYSQTYQPIDYARLYTLKKCLDINYIALDSLYYKKNADITSSIVLQTLSIEQTRAIDKEVKNKAGNYYKSPVQGTYDLPHANQIVYNCWRLYESSEMKNFLRKVVKK